MEIKDIVVDAQEVRGGNNDFAAFGNVVGFNTGSTNTVNQWQIGGNALAIGVSGGDNSMNSLQNTFAAVNNPQTAQAGIYDQDAVSLNWHSTANQLHV